MIDGWETLEERFRDVPDSALVVVSRTDRR